MVNARIEQFYKDIRALDIKSPVSAIAEATGENKGNVSKYLNQKMQPSESFLNRFYMKFGKVVQKSDTTKPQEAQNPPKSGADHSDTRTEIDKLVARIKAETGLIEEEIAERVGISRQWLHRLCNTQPYSEANYLKIYEAFKDELKDKLTTSTKIPGFEMKPTSGTPTVQDVTIKNLSDLTKSQQELLVEWSGKLITLVSKVIDKL